MGVSIPSNYSLGPFASKSNRLPETLVELESWLKKNSRGGRWRGKIYVASTITWNKKEFWQDGCAPNYRAGLWSLTTCKNSMRSAGVVPNTLVPPQTEDLFIFTLACQDETNRQTLVSVARVTEHFADMAEYESHLRSNRDPNVLSSRLSRVRQDDGNLGWRFGDCHTDGRGNIGRPDHDHVHGKNGDWRSDNDGSHTLLTSDEFLLWAKPKFVARNTIFQSGYGHNIDAQSLRQLLK